MSVTSRLTEVLAEVLMDHLTQRGPAGNVSGCECGQLRLGESWSLHVAELQRAALDQQPLVRLTVPVQAGLLAQHGIRLVPGTGHPATPPQPWETTE